jgi:hypothetical protein
MREPNEDHQLGALGGCRNATCLAAQMEAHLPAFQGERSYRSSIITRNHSRRGRSSLCPRGHRFVPLRFRFGVIAKDTALVFRVSTDSPTDLDPNLTPFGPSRPLNEPSLKHLKHETLRFPDRRHLEVNDEPRHVQLTRVMKVPAIRPCSEFEVLHCAISRIPQAGLKLARFICLTLGVLSIRRDFHQRSD